MWDNIIFRNKSNGILGERGPSILDPLWTLCTALILLPCLYLTQGWIPQNIYCYLKAGFLELPPHSSYHVDNHQTWFKRPHHASGALFVALCIEFKTTMLVLKAKSGTAYFRICVVIRCSVTWLIKRTYIKEHSLSVRTARFSPSEPLKFRGFLQSISYRCYNNPHKVKKYNKPASASPPFPC